MSIYQFTTKPKLYRVAANKEATEPRKEKLQKDKQRSTKHAYKTKDRVTRTPLKIGGELRCSGRCIMMQFALRVESEPTQHNNYNTISIELVRSICTLLVRRYFCLVC
jgi:hypothetical protein